VIDDVEVSCFPPTSTVATAERVNETGIPVRLFCTEGMSPNPLLAGTVTAAGGGTETPAWFKAGVSQGLTFTVTVVVAPASFGWENGTRHDAVLAFQLGCPMLVGALMEPKGVTTVNGELGWLVFPLSEAVMVMLYSVAFLRPVVVHVNVFPVHAE